MNAAHNAGTGPPPVTAVRTSSKTAPTGENAHAKVLGTVLLASPSHPRRLNYGYAAEFNPLQIKSVVPKHKRALQWL